MLLVGGDLAAQADGLRQPGLGQWIADRRRRGIGHVRRLEVANPHIEQAHHAGGGNLESVDREVVLSRQVEQMAEPAGGQLGPGVGIDEVGAVEAAVEDELVRRFQPVVGGPGTHQQRRQVSVEQAVQVPAFDHRCRQAHGAELLHGAGGLAQQVGSVG